MTVDPLSSAGAVQLKVSLWLADAVTVSPVGASGLVGAVLDAVWDAEEDQLLSPVLLLARTCT